MGAVTKGKVKITIELDRDTHEYLKWLKSESRMRSIGALVDEIVFTARRGGFVVGDPKFSLAIDHPLDNQELSFSSCRRSQP